MDADRRIRCTDDSGHRGWVAIGRAGRRISLRIGGQTVYVEARDVEQMRADLAEVRAESLWGRSF